MDTTFESRVWQRALDRGLLSTRQVNDCLKDSNSTAPTLRLTEILVSKGHLNADQVTEIRGQLAFAEPEAPDEVRAAAKDPRKLIGRYVVLEELGRGGMGIVYRAWDGDLRRFVALKVLSGPWDDEDLARFRREAQSAAALNHPNIITVFEISPSDECPYIALELVDGETLDGRKLAARKAAELMVEIARAVDAAHKRGIIHRDLKPSNIMIDAKGSPRVMDFGIAKAMRSASHITVSGTVVGTPSYMAPEAAQGRIREVDQRSDIFSLGAMLYELLTGRTPFRGRTPLETLTAVVECKPARPRTLTPSVPRPLEAILLTCLQKDRFQRYVSCEALARDLERFLRGEKVVARIPFAMSSRLVFALSAGITFAAGLTAVFWPSTPPPPAPPPQQPRAAAPRPADRSHLDLALRLMEEARLDLYRAGIALPAVTAKLREAERLLDVALKTDPGSGAAFLARGDLRMRLNRLDEALPDYVEAIRLLPTSPAVHLARGHLMLERYLRELQFASKTELTDDMRRWSEEARADFIKARDLSPSRNDLPYLHAWLAIVDLKFDEAIRIATTALPTAERPEEFYKLRGDAHALHAERSEPESQAGHWNSAVEDYTHAIRLCANYTEAYRLRGATYWHLKKHDAASRDFQKVLDMDPNDSRALSDMGTFQTHSGRLDQALDLFNRAVAADGGNLRALTNRASIYLQQKRYAEARRDLEKAVAINPRHLASLYNLAVTIHRVGDAPEALRRLDEILNRAPNFPRGLAYRGVIHYEATRWKEALADFERAVALDPSQEAVLRPGIEHCRSELRRRR